MTISCKKSKVMAFIRQEPIRCKITINDKIFEKVNEFKYLECHISYEGERDVKNKISKFLQVTGTINNVLKPNQVQKSSRMKIYNTLAIPALIYGSEIWTLTQQDKSRLKASEMKFLRRTAGYTLLDRKKNEDILQELNTTPVLENITKYRHNWVKHIHCMNSSRFPKALIEYHPCGRRRPGRPFKRLLDGVQIETETGHMGLFRDGIR
jgi:hypothetical protein